MERDYCYRTWITGRARRLKRATSPSCPAPHGVPDRYLWLVARPRGAPGMGAAFARVSCALLGDASAFVLALGRCALRSREADGTGPWLHNLRALLTPQAMGNLGDSWVSMAYPHSQCPGSVGPVMRPR